MHMYKVADVMVYSMLVLLVVHYFSLFVVKISQQYIFFQNISTVQINTRSAEHSLNSEILAKM
jgi:hypothetical protein